MYPQFPQLPSPPSAARSTPSFRVADRRGLDVGEERPPQLQPLDGRVEVDDVEGLLGAALHLQLHLLQDLLRVGHRLRCGVLGRRRRRLELVQLVGSERVYGR